MATYTTNYHLKKPAQEDFYNVDDFNGNCDIIDDTMKSLSTRTSNIESDINGLAEVAQSGSYNDLVDKPKSLDVELTQAEYDALSEEEKNNDYTYFITDGDEISEDKANILQNQINVQTSRIDQLTTLEDGSTTGDAELSDIRIGYDGVTYDNAGNAVRGQIGELKEDLDDLYSDVVLDFSYSGYIDTTGKFVEMSSFVTTDYIETTPRLIFDGWFNSLKNFNYVNCYDLNKNHLGGMFLGGSSIISLKRYLTTLPDNTVYVRITTHKTIPDKISVKYVPMSASEYENMSKKNAELEAKFEFLDSEYKSTMGEYNVQDVEWVAGYVQPDGWLDSKSDSFRRTDMIKIPNNAIGVRVKNYTLKADLLSLCFYSSNYDPKVSKVASFSSATDIGDYYGTIPLNAKYYAVSKHRTNEDFSVSFLYGSYISNKLGETEKKFEDYNNMLTLYGKCFGFASFSKFASIGDSLSVGYHTQSDDTVVTKDLMHSWGKYIENTTGAKSYWTGISGATCKSWLETTSQDWGLNYCRSIGTMPLYVICMGANESAITIGTVEDIGTNNSTLYAYVSRVISELRNISPKSYIVCTGVSRKRNDTSINDVYRNVCAHFEKCYFLDCAQEFNTEPMTNYYFNFHYSASGYSMIANLFDYKLKEVMIANVEDFKYINECDN